MALSPRRPWTRRACLPGTPLAALWAAFWTALRATLLASLLAACALPPPQPGADEAEVRRLWGAPTDLHRLPGGGQRLEYATGPYGKTTWMIDLGADGRLLAARQVLQPGVLLALPPGLTREELRREIGRPGEVQPVWRGAEVWSWRYENNDCLWFRATIGADGRFQGGGFMPDPACDAGDSFE